MQRQGALWCGSFMKELGAYSVPSLTIGESAPGETQRSAGCSPARKNKTENPTLVQMQSCWLYLRSSAADGSGAGWKTLKRQLGEAASQQQFDQVKKLQVKVFLTLKMLTTLTTNAPTLQNVFFQLIRLQ